MAVAVVNFARRPNLTDRAYRYRAARKPPTGPKQCAFCGSKQKIMVGHLDGHEENEAASNLVWTCRRCNTLVSNAMRKAGRGRLTHQYNPSNEGAKSLGQWVLAVQSMKGESDAMTVPQAVEMIRATPSSARSRFASEIWRRRRSRGTDKSGVPF